MSSSPNPNLNIISLTGHTLLRTHVVELMGLLVPTPPSKKVQYKGPVPFGNKDTCTIQAYNTSSFACFSCCSPIAFAWESSTGQLPVQKCGEMSSTSLAFAIAWHTTILSSAISQALTLTVLCKSGMAHYYSDATLRSSVVPLAKSI